MGDVLLYCNSKGELNKLLEKGKKRLAEKRIVVITDSVNFYSMVKDNYKTEYFIEENLRYGTCDFPEFYDLCHQYNKLFRKINMEAPLYLFEIDAHWDSAVAIDLRMYIYCIRRMEELLSSYRVESIVIAKGREHLRKTLIKKIAVLNHLPVYEYHYIFFNIREFLTDTYKFSICESAILHVKMLFKVLKNKQSLKENLNKDKIIFSTLIQNKARRFVDYINPLFQAIQKDMLCHGVLLCFMGEENRRYASEQGLIAVNLESYLKKSDFYERYMVYKKCVRAIRKNAKHANIQINGLDVSELIVKLMRYDIKTRGLYNFLLERCYSAFLREERVDIVIASTRSGYVWNRIVSVYRQTLDQDLIIAYYNVNANFTKLKVLADSRSIDEEYDVVFWFNSRIKGEYYKYYKRAEHYVVNSPYLVSLIRQYINFPRQYIKGNLKIIWLSSNAKDIRENKYILDMCGAAKNVELYIKCHPAIDDTTVISYLNEFAEGKSHIRILDRKLGLKKCFEDMNIAINTSASQSALEMLCAGLPSLCMYNNMEYEFMRDIGGILKYRDREMFKKLLASLITDLNFASKWCEERVGIQNEYLLKELLVNNNLNPEREIVTFLFNKYTQNRRT